MRRAIRGVLVMLLFSIVGCDPGITIHQAVQCEKSAASLPAPDPSYLTISVKTTHPLAGYNFYEPVVTVTNSSASSINVNGVELTAKGIVYANKRQQAYPIVVAAGQSQTLEVWFDLREDLWTTFFRQPADLRVNYVRDGREMTAHAAVVGDRLNTKTP